jgi:hypothetical protein
VRVLGFAVELISPLGRIATGTRLRSSISISCNLRGVAVVVGGLGPRGLPAEKAEGRA